MRGLSVGTTVLVAVALAAGGGGIGARQAASPGDAPRVIAIDAGHGGSDTGVRSEDGLEEKAATLAIAHRLRMRLESRAGFRVVMTRDDDRQVDADARAMRANVARASLFVSLHANASFSPATSGLDVLAPRPDLDADAVRLGREDTGLATGRRPGSDRLLPWDFAYAPQADESWRLAAVVQDELGRALPMRSTGRHRVPLRDLVGTTMPAVVVELGYLTNAEDAALLAADDFATSVVDALTTSLTRFFTEDAAEP